jgi:alkylation response protein AidB-like acyl-CoA dehydrogenase
MIERRMDSRERGRALLAEWAATRPPNVFDDDLYLRFALTRHIAPDRLDRLTPALRQAGEDSAGPVDRAAGELDRAEHLPRLEAWSAVGERAEQIRFDAAHHAVGRLVWRSGILAVLGEPGGVTAHTALEYLFAQNGEVPHLCSVACTAGLVKAIQRAGAEWMRREWLPRLLEPDYDRRWHGAQFLTEVQGGSDVGANACVARPVEGEPGTWRLTGEKWFCSNVSADLAAVSARPAGAQAGTSGIGLFVVPWRLADGRPNGVFIRRLKDKLGTRTLPTAEVDITDPPRDALAYSLGPPADGFRLLMGVIINTSRLAVATSSTGIMRRAWTEAWRYARLREAFGQRLVDLPAIRRQLAEIRALWAGGLAATLFVAGLEDRLTLAGVHPEDDPLFRAAVTVNKLVCSIDAGLAVHHAIEILGGNGVIEDLSPLPRLYREVPVQESWEGPHNTLVAQVLRDAARAKMHEAVLGRAEETLLGASAPALAPARDRGLAALGEVRARFGRLLSGDPGVAALHAREVVSRLGRLLQVSLLLDDAARAEGVAGLRWLGAAAELLLDRDLRSGYDAPEDPGYPARIARLLET